MSFDSIIKSDLDSRNIINTMGYIVDDIPMSESLSIFIYCDEIVMSTSDRIFVYVYYVMYKNQLYEYHLEVTDNLRDGVVICGANKNEFISYNDLLNTLTAMSMGIM